MRLPEEVILSRIKTMLINSIDSLKDEEFQRRVWFRNEGPEADSYGDACIFLIDECESIFKQPGCVDYLGTENYEHLKKLYDLVSDHFGLTQERIIDTDLLQEDELLNDPNWHDIQMLAGEVEEKLTEFVKRKEDEPKNKR